MPMEQGLELAELFPRLYYRPTKGGRYELFQVHSKTKWLWNPCGPEHAKVLFHSSISRFTSIFLSCPSKELAVVDNAHNAPKNNVVKFHTCANNISRPLCRLNESNLTEDLELGNIYVYGMEGVCLEEKRFGQGSVCHQKAKQQPMYFQWGEMVLHRMIPTLEASSLLCSLS